MNFLEVEISENQVIARDRDGQEYAFSRDEFRKYRNDNSPYGVEHKLPRKDNVYPWDDLKQEVQLDIRNFIYDEILKEEQVRFQRIS